MPNPSYLPVRLGVVGLGWWGGVLAVAAQTTGAIEVAYCFARSGEASESFAVEHGCTPAGSLDELLRSDIDGVLVATPHTTHADLVVAAARAGKHVFVDKPLTLTVAEADRAIDAASDAGVMLQVGHNRRRQPANRWIKQALNDGELGDLLAVTSTHAAPLLFNPNLAPWRRDLAESPVGGMAALGIHQIDNFHYLAGPIAAVLAESTQLLPDGEVDDTSMISLRFGSGALGHLFTSMATGPVVELSAFGTAAIARNTGDGTRLTLQSRGSTDQTEVSLEPLDTVADQLGEFAAAIRGETKPETDGNEARRAVAVLEAIAGSNESHGWVEVVYP